MQYSMRARFQGALWGARLGSSWIGQEQVAAAIRFDPILPGESPKSAKWALEGAIALAQHLIAYGTQDLPWPLWQPEADSLSDRPTQLAFLALPLALYCHDNPTRLHQCLDQAVETWQLPLAVASPAKALGQVLAIACGSTLDPSQFAPSVRLALHPGNLGALPEPQWNWLNTTLQHRQSLAMACSTLPTAPDAPVHLATALLIWLTSPTDAVQALDRAVQLTASALTVALVGAIAGSFNGLAALPECFQEQGDRPALLSNEQSFASSEPWLHLADALLASWAGLYLPQQVPLPSRVLQAIAPARLIQRRLSTTPRK